MDRSKKTANRLTTLFVNSRKAEPGLHSDGANNLYLSVRPSGSRSWVFRYRTRDTGRQREMGLGPAGPEGVSLQDARDRATALKADLRNGIDPIAVRQAVAAVEPAPAKKLFGDYAINEWLPVYAGGFKNPRTATDVRRSLEIHAASLFPMAIADITKAEVLAVLNPIWHKIPKTAREVRARIETVLQAATPTYRQGPNPAVWRANLDSNFGKETPAKRKMRIKKHPAVPYAELPAVVQALRERHKTAETNVNLALEFLILTGARTDEVRSMPPSEIDFDKRLWKIEAERMKANEAHVVPLSDRATAILRSVVKPNQPFVFEGLRMKTDDPDAPLKPLGHNAMAHALKAVKPGFTTHGLRSSLRDWLGEETEYPRELAEHALAHTVGDDSELSYRRGRAIERRRPMMEAWAAFIG